MTIATTRKYYQEHPEERNALKEYFAKHPEAETKHNKKLRRSLEEQETNSERGKRYFKENPGAGKRNSERMRNSPKILSQEVRKKMSDSAKKRFENPDERKKHGERVKKIRQSPETRKKQSEIMKIRWMNSEAKREMCKTMSESRKKYFINIQWYGSVKYHDDRPIYCEKWTEELKERVRAFTGYVCFECGTPQNGKKLAVHHVHYNKKLCCDDTPRSLVPLCPSCHSATNSNREYWSEHFQDMIDNYHDGKCWLTKEEMKLLKNGGQL